MKYGLDFGTSNSAISYRDGGKVRLLPVDPGSKIPEIMPSLWYFEELEKRWFFGAEALFEYKENGGEGRFIQSLKKLLPDESFTGTHVGYRFYCIEDLLFLYIDEMKKRADRLVGKNVTAVSIGRPVRFSRDLHHRLAEKRLEGAARRAGFETIDFMLEPLAATYTLKKELAGPSTVFTLDMGGGTSDVSIVRLYPEGDTRDRVLAAEGISIGGVDFTSAVMQNCLLPHFGMGTTYKSLFNKEMNFPRYALRHVIDWYNSLKMINNRKFMAFLKEVEKGTNAPDAIRALHDLVYEKLGLDVFSAIEEAKVILSTLRATKIGYAHGAVDISEPITRQDFESYIDGHRADIVNMIETALKRARIGPDGIDAVLLVGGSSKIPLFVNLMKKLFPAASLYEADTFTSVAHGLSVAEFDRGQPGNPADTPDATRPIPRRQPNRCAWYK